MSDSRHTPGPWIDVAPPIQCEKGSPFKIINETYRDVRAGRGYFKEAEPHGGFTVTGFISPEDAALIAAAPDLLAACELMVGFDNAEENLSDQVWLETLAECAEKARAAIRKAKGEKVESGE